MKGEIHFCLLFSVSLFSFSITLVACNSNNVPISTTKNIITPNISDDNNCVVLIAVCSDSYCKNNVYFYRSQTEI